MVSPNAAAAFAVLVLVMVVVPGPSVLFTISRALTVGRRDALLTVAGNVVGVYTQVVAVAFGLGTLVEQSAALFTVVKLAGAGYLVYLGIKAFRGRRALIDVLGEAGRTAGVRPLRTLKDGFVVGFANPKSIVFLAAVLPQFVHYGSGSVPMQILLLGILIPGIGLFTDTAWALLAGTARTWFARSPRRLELIGGAGGLTMIGLGVGLAITGRKD